MTVQQFAASWAPPQGMAFARQSGEAMIYADEATGHTLCVAGLFFKVTPEAEWPAMAANELLRGREKIKYHLNQMAAG